MVTANNKTWLVDFIELYRSHACLWDVCSKDYTNKLLKDQALSALQEKCKEIHPNADKNYVRKRIANIRTSFSREYKKIKQSKRTGSGADEVYATNLWYYNHLLFLKDGETSRRGISTLGGYEHEYEEEIPEVSLSQTPMPPNTQDVNDASASLSLQTASKKKLSLQQQQSMFFEKAAEYMSSKQSRDEDDFDIAGKRIASHYRTMEANQFLLAERIISDVMMHARANQLTYNSKFFVDPPFSSQGGSTAAQGALFAGQTLSHCPNDGILSEFLNFGNR